MEQNKIKEQNILGFICPKCGGDIVAGGQKNLKEKNINIDLLPLAELLNSFCLVCNNMFKLF